MVTRLPLRRADHADMALAGVLLLDRLQGVAGEIAQYAEELVAVGIDAQPIADLDRPVDGAFARQAEAVADLIDERPQRQQLAPGRRLLGAAEFQRAVGERDGAAERGDQLRREALHRRVGQAAQPVRDQLRVGQHVAQVVVDLADGEPERGEPALLLQGLRQLLLHVRELALGGADLVLALRGHDDAAGVLRVLAEAQHVAGNAHHRLHQQAVEGEVDERRGDHRDDHRQPQDVEAVADHGRPQRRLRQHHLDEVAGAHAGLADHPDDAALLGHENAERVPDQAQAQPKLAPHAPWGARWRESR